MSSPNPKATPQPMPVPKVVLASGSPRRREILESLGFEIEVRPVDVDETPLPGEKASSYVLRLARDKAAEQAHEGELVLGADTIVVDAGQILGKPADEEEAKEMLRRLSGKPHEVLTAVAVNDVGAGLQVAFVEKTRVVFKDLDENEVDWYVATGEPLDKAGAYGIQGRAALFVEAIQGDYSNVVGLPVAALYRLLRQAGYALPNLPAPPSDA